MFRRPFDAHKRRKRRPRELSCGGFSSVPPLVVISEITLVVISEITLVVISEICDADLPICDASVPRGAQRYRG